MLPQIRSRVEAEGQRLKRYDESYLSYLFKELSFVTFHCVCARNEMWIL